MEACETLIVGGGPGGSSCAWSLRRAGMDVLVMDAARFPRDKTCAGWITPQVLADLQLDVDDYRQGRVFQPITGFRTGLIDGPCEVATRYGRPVSFGIRRCEFDHYLLERSGARLQLGTPVRRIRRDGDFWVVNERVRSRMLVGAGGHFCPVARWLNPRPDAVPLVVAQEAEFPVHEGQAGAGSYAIDACEPELYFCADLKGYGWCFRKEGFVNLGIGRLGGISLPRTFARFVAFLKRRRRIPESASWHPRGHAYLVSEPPCRTLTGPGVLLLGDAAGLACPQSGEGIGPAIRSGLLAASTILDEAGGACSMERLEPYERRLRAWFGAPRISTLVGRVLPAGLAARSAPSLLGSAWFTRHVVLDRWFLHASRG
jgi:flavin-dependent dehydrogenase